MTVGIVLLITKIDVGSGPEIVLIPMLLRGLGIGALASQLGWGLTVSSVPDSASAEPSTRAQRWASRILDDMTHNPRSFTAHVLNNFFDSEHLVKEFYEELKNEHAVALNKHKQSIHVG